VGLQGLICKTESNNGFSRIIFQKEIPCAGSMESGLGGTLGSTVDRAAARTFAQRRIADARRAWYCRVPELIGRGQRGRG
jgi:hypothetical protein